MFPRYAIQFQTCIFFTVNSNFFGLMLVIGHKDLMEHMFPMQMMVVEWILAQFENA